MVKVKAAFDIALYIVHRPRTPGPASSTVSRVLKTEAVTPNHSINEYLQSEKKMLSLQRNE